MFEMSLDKMLLLGFLAVVLIGPTRLPAAAAHLGRFVRQARQWTETATTRMQDEFGPDFNAADLKRLDPRQYDPRRIIRDALRESTPAPRAVPDAGVRDDAQGDGPDR